MAVRIQNGRRRESLLFEVAKDLVRLQARVDHHAIGTVSEMGNIGVLLKGVRDDGGELQVRRLHEIGLLTRQENG